MQLLILVVGNYILKIHEKIFVNVEKYMNKLIINALEVLFYY